MQRKHPLCNRGNMYKVGCDCSQNKWLCLRRALCKDQHIFDSDRLDDADNQSLKHTLVYTQYMDFPDSLEYSCMPQHYSVLYIPH